MKTRLTEAQRTAYEKRLRELRIAAQEPGKVSGIVDKVSEGQSDIKGVVESLMRLMDADSEAARYHTASAKLSRVLKKAMELANAEGETPVQEAHDLASPILHPIEDLEHEIQTMDDARLMQEVEKLEHDIKQDLHGAHEQAAAPAAAPAAGQFPAAPAPAPAPAAAPAPKAEAPKAAPAAHGGEEKAEKTEDESEDKSEGKELSPEHKLALLMSLPAGARAKKVANLRALANALERAEKEVSNDNQISTEKSEESLANDYKDQENGSMKDVKAAALVATAKQLLAAFEEDADEKDEEKDEKMDKEAVLKLALKHLVASIEDMNEEKDEDKSEKLPFFEKSEDEKGEEEDKEGAEPSLDEKKAILRARLASLRRTATVDGKTMKTPKEVPSPSGTTEDNLKGDAPIQYSTNRADTSLDEIQTTRQKVKDDKSVAGTDEPNEIYFSSSPTKDRYEPTSEKDSSKEVSNKRVLKDMGTAVQPSAPHAPDEMEQGAGSHQKTKDWEKAKAESDTTPSGDRLVGLANLNEIIKQRTDRAVRLASHMAELHLITTEKQLGEKIASLAAMDDDAFKTVEAFLADSVASTARTRVAAAEEADEDEDEEEDNHREAGLVRRASASRTASYVDEDEDEDAPAVRRVEASTRRRAERGPLKTPLLSGTEDITSHRASTILRRADSAIADKLSAIAWTDPKVEARRKAAELDDIFHGER